MKAAVIPIIVIVVLVGAYFMVSMEDDSGGNKAPKAVIRYEGVQQAGKLIRFYSDDSSDPDGDPLSYHWSFGDGATWPTKNTQVYHRYQEPGSYTVTLVVNDGSKNSKTTVDLTITESDNRRPYARAEDVGMVFLDEEDGEVTVRFDANGSSDPDNDDLFFYWDFNDTVDLNNDSIMNNDAEAEGASVDWTFDQWGDHNVTLTVADGEGESAEDILTDTDRIVVMVRWPTPQADLEAQRRDGILLDFEIWLRNVTRNIPIEEANWYLVREGSTYANGSLADSGDVTYRDDDVDGNISSEDNIAIQSSSDSEPNDVFYITYTLNEVPGQERGGFAAQIGYVLLPET